MKEKLYNAKKKTKKVVYGLVALIIFMLISGITYAFFSANITKINETETKVKSNKLGLIYTGVKDINITDIIPGDYMTKTFTVENTSNRAVDYNIYMEDVLNEFNNDLIYTLIDQDGVVIEEGPLPVTTSGKKYIKTKVSIDTGVIKSYTLTIKFKYNATESQNTLQGAIFSTTLGIDTEIVGKSSNDQTGTKYTIVTDVNSNGVADIGDEINITNTDEKFYVILNDGSKIRALAKYNVDIESRNSTQYLATGLQNELVVGAKDGMPNYGRIEFSTMYYKGENFNDYQGSVAKLYVDNYITKINDLNSQLNASGRLLLKEEMDLLINDGTPLPADYIKEKANDKGYSWLYYTNYWLGTAEGNYKIWVVFTDGYFNYYNYDYIFGIRPVIEFTI